MKIMLRILFISFFFLAGYDGLAQVPTTQEGVRDVKVSKESPSSDQVKVPIDEDSGPHKENKGAREENVKQVKSGRPDMTRTRGARPPNIVRPSGSRIPKGVGRPAGAGRRGR